MYGQLSSFAGSLINFPQVLTQAVAMSLVPLVAAAFKQRDLPYLRENVQYGLRMSVILGLPCALGLFALAEPILVLLYPSQQASAIGAAPALMVMSIGVVFLSTVQTLTGVLQGIGKVNIPLRNAAVSLVLHVVLLTPLLYFTNLNLYALVFATMFYAFLMCLLNNLSVR